MRRCDLLVPLIFVIASGAIATDSASAHDKRFPEEPAIQGCLGENVTNGIWRVRITGLRRVTRKTLYSDDAPPTGWGVSVVWTNVGETVAKRMKTVKGPPGLTRTGVTRWALFFPSGYGFGSLDYAGSSEMHELGGSYDQTHELALFDREFPPGVPRSGEVRFFFHAKDPRYQGKPIKLLISGEPYVEPHWRDVRILFTCKR